jgi:hypothetical protein
VTGTVVRARHALHRNAGADVMAMLPGGGDVHLLSGPAAVIWDLVADRVTTDDLIGVIAELYGRPDYAVRPSVEDCIRTLTSQGLLEPHRA